MENKVLTHFWFKQDVEDVYHAFLRPQIGSEPLCKKGMAFDSLEAMNIPGYRSKCCNVCMDTLYGTKSELTKEKHESRINY